MTTRYGFEHLDEPLYNEKATQRNIRKASGKCEQLSEHLYWLIGSHTKTFILQGERAAYGQKIIISLSKRLILKYGKRWSSQHLRQSLIKTEAVTSSGKRLLSFYTEGSCFNIKKPLEQYQVAF